MEEGMVYYPEFQPYLLGVVERCGLPRCLVYDREAVLEHLTKELGNYEDAIEWFEFNVIGGYVGETTPFFFDRDLAFEFSRAAPEPDGSLTDP